MLPALEPLREATGEISDWRTFPQLYVKGELVGGCDIVEEMFDSGELAELLGVEQPKRRCGARARAHPSRRLAAEPADAARLEAAVDIVVAGIAVMAFAATVFVLAGAAGRVRGDSVRTVLLPEEGEEWMTLAEVAAFLDVSTSEIGALVERGDIPFFLIRGGELSNPEYWRFKRDEIERWTIG